MGKEWLSWVGGGGGGGGGKSRSATKRGKMRGEMGEASAGCMCAVFHLFHVHHFQFPSSHRNHSNTNPNVYPFLQEPYTTTATGVEAPRNSLELDETAAMAAASSMPVAMNQEEDLNFPVGIKLKTSHSRRKARLDYISSECNSPAGTKSPSVVARLMGLDLLPQSQCTSPNPNTKPRKDTNLLQIDHYLSAARSLPETPRTSSSSSRKSDVERHRLSLQINKENAFSLSDGGGRRGTFKQDDKRRSVGLDITNINRNSTRDQNKPLTKKISKCGEEEVSKQKPIKSPRISSSSDINHQPNHIPLLKERQQHKDSKKVSSSTRFKKLPARAAASRREDGCVRSRERNKLHMAQNKCKRTALSSCDILNVNGPTILQVKNGGLPQKQSQVSNALSWKSSTQLSSTPSQSYNPLQLQHDKTLTTVSSCSTNGGATALHGGASPEHRNYIQIILKHTGIINQVNPLAKWHAPSQPIDPEIFHHLELKAAAAVDGCNTVLSNRCERKLIFQLVDELLAEILAHHFKMNRWISPVGDCGCSRLVDDLCKKIGSFPAAKCLVLEDIDSLIDKDLCKSQSNGFWGEEEDMVCEIEGEIMEWLVREAVAVMGGDAAEEKTEAGIRLVRL